MTTLFRKTQKPPSMKIQYCYCQFRTFFIKTYLKEQGRGILRSRNMHSNTVLRINNVVFINWSEKGTIKRNEEESRIDIL